jgi:ubiquinone biosynthesis protein Coq4
VPLLNPKYLVRYDNDDLATSTNPGLQAKDLLNNEWEKLNRMLLERRRRTSQSTTAPPARWLPSCLR